MVGSLQAIFMFSYVIQQGSIKQGQTDQYNLGTTSIHPCCVTYELFPQSKFAMLN